MSRPESTASLHLAHLSSSRRCKNFTKFLATLKIYNDRVNDMSGNIYFSKRRITLLQFGSAYETIYSDGAF